MEEENPYVTLVKNTSQYKPMHILNLNLFLKEIFTSFANDWSMVPKYFKYFQFQS